MTAPQFRRYKGKLEQSKGKIHVRVEISQSKAQSQRIGEVILAYDCTINATHMMKHGYGMGATLIMKLPYEHIEEAMGDLKPHHWEYNSPTFFNRGSIISIYKTPEDEVNDRPCKRYVEHAKEIRR